MTRIKELIQQHNNVLFTPLNMGLGHATRIIPIIEEFIKAKKDVWIASDGDSLSLLKDQFPEAHFIELPGYKVQYQRFGSLSITLAKQLPRLKKVISAEKNRVNDLVSNNNIDLIISDHRYGCYNKKVNSVFVCHQLKFKAGIWSLFVNKTHKKLVRNFNEVLIPDFPEFPGLGGQLSHTIIHPKQTWIGPLSRFENLESLSIQNKYKAGFVISGPEPQRSIFENIVIAYIKQYPSERFFIVKGTPLSVHQQALENADVFNHLSTEELWLKIHQTNTIVSRSGYSSIMDYQYYNGNVFYVPTPQQTEQEYLAKIQKKTTFVVRQHELLTKLPRVLNE